MYLLTVKIVQLHEVQCLVHQLEIRTSIIIIEVVISN